MPTEIVAARILSRAGASLTADTAGEALVGYLADYQVPARIEVVDSLPRDDSGKVYQLQVRNRCTAEVSVESGDGVQGRSKSPLPLVRPAAGRAPVGR
ncbi:hypothetical protein GCM10011610_63090 [Nocardia rhizosphaerihabitans]|uniref:Uncharacterized protein n=1 Tax=Nocardia rhizosphaerihabitans TaxID=1691570 RepID=A0ABQ2KZ58_9NOCA|nr:hypothetical protein GCM10011610_63090 [Nocardia rhizosphaerihabitans]